MSEANLQKKIINALREMGAWVFNVHGSPFQKKGTPDLLICYKGYFIALEIKLPGKEDTLTKLQRKRIEEIRKAGGLAYMVTSVWGVVELLKNVDKKLENKG